MSAGQHGQDNGQRAGFSCLHAMLMQWHIDRQTHCVNTMWMRLIWAQTRESLALSGNAGWELH